MEPEFLTAPERQPKGGRWARSAQRPGDLQKCCNTRPVVVDPGSVDHRVEVRSQHDHLPVPDPPKFGEDRPSGGLFGVGVGHQARGRAARCCCHKSLRSLLGGCRGWDRQASGIEEGWTQHDAGRDLGGDCDEGGGSGLLSGDDLVAAQTVTRPNQHDRVSGECAIVANSATRARRFGGVRDDGYDRSCNVAGRGEDEGPEVLDSIDPMTDFEGRSAVVDERHIVIGVRLNRPACGSQLPFNNSCRTVIARTAHRPEPVGALHCLGKLLESRPQALLSNGGRYLLSVRLASGRSVGAGASTCQQRRQGNRHKGAWRGGCSHPQATHTERPPAPHPISLGPHWRLELAPGPGQGLAGGLTGQEEAPARGDGPERGSPGETPAGNDPGRAPFMAGIGTGVWDVEGHLRIGFCAHLLSSLGWTTRP